MTVEMLPVVYYRAIGVALKKAHILYRDGGRELLAGQSIGERSIVGYFFGLLVYDNFSSRVSRFKKHGEINRMKK